MKNARKLIPALAMLLVSAILMTTASFAWFSMNETVTATGMSVTASAPTSLLISNTSATEGFGSTVALQNDVTGAATEFAPVAFADSCTSFYKLTNTAMKSIDSQGRAIAGSFTEVADGQSAATFTGTVDADNNPVYDVEGGKNVYHDRVWLRVDGDSNMDVKARVAFTAEPTEAIKNAMHVVFVVGGTTIKGNIDMSGDKTTDVLTTLVKNAANGTQIDIYYFLSGNDQDCKNTNISQDQTMGITITFGEFND